MKKPLKITLISLGSLIGLIIIVLAVVSDLVLNPKRSTRLVNKYASNFITCDYNIGKVDISLFKTFPDVGVEIQDLVLVNSMPGCQNDTLAAVDECVIALNIKELLSNNNIIINKANLRGGSINVFSDADGAANFDIFAGGEEEEVTEESDEPFSYRIDLDRLIVSDINLTYNDLASNTAVSVQDFAMTLKANVDEKLNLNDVLLDFGLGKTSLLMGGDSDISADFDAFSFETECVMREMNAVDCSSASVKIDSITVALGEDTYLAKTNVSLISKSPLKILLNEKDLTINDLSLAINDLMITLAGRMLVNENDIDVNLDLNTNTWDVAEVIGMVPSAVIGDALDGMSVDGQFKLSANVSGVYNDSLMPVVTADLAFNDGTLEMSDLLPFPLKKINAGLNARLDLNGRTDVTLKSLKANMNNSSFDISGNVSDALNDTRCCDVRLKADVKTADVKSFIPEDIKVKGAVLADVSVKGRVSDLTELDIAKSRIDAKLTLKDLALCYCDTIDMSSERLSLSLAFPRHAAGKIAGDLVQLNVGGTNLNAEMSDMMSVNVNDFGINGLVPNILDDSQNLSVVGDFAFSHLLFNMDDMNLDVDNSCGELAMLPSVNNGNVSYTAIFSSDSLAFSMDGLGFSTESIALDALADYDESKDNVLVKWNPKFDINLSNALVDVDGLDKSVIIPSVNMKFNDEGLFVEDSKVVLGNSDFSLEGTMTNLVEHVRDNELLRADFKFTSAYTDVNELLGLVSGMGSSDTVAESAAADTVVKEDDPFMVPLGTDITLHTLIEKASFANVEVNNVGGDFTVKDGNFVLREVGFTTDAATMLITGIYKSPRKNNLYAGFDFHLLNIDIAEMINLVPDIDTIVPMLKSFAGKAEFHLAAETNLKSDYSIKYSTLKAACSIEGKDLVVLDNETFNTIKSMLMFDKNTGNRIDSLDVQFTLFRNEIDVYPFVVSLDKYQAALYGRHNLDMSYDYNISVLNPPILNMLGLEIKGPDFDNMNFKLRKGKIKNIYKPEKRNYVEEEIMNLKKVISNSLKENVEKNY
ncbi:MAG: AsmA family protein [Bacteroidales bacterium]|nr:AsmA family protein [Bacteroidales bacterium]